MLQFPFARIFTFALTSLVALGLSSCVVYDRPYGPGYVRQVPPPVGVGYYDYWYYPDAQVYFDTNRRVYFYFSNQRWVETRVLPPYWRSRMHNYVPIHSRHERPYIEYREHSIKYPPRVREEYRQRERDDYRDAPRYRNDVYPRNYQEMPRKEPPLRTQQQFLEQQQERGYREQPQPDSRIKSPVRQRYQEMPGKGPLKNVTKQAHEKAKEQKNEKQKKGKESQKSKDNDQQDDQDRRRRDNR